jgi:fructose 1,6-bisphosphate aldolase/phosphatase
MKAPAIIDLLARDLLGDVSFDRAHVLALEVTDYMRRLGHFEPGRLPMDEMEYTTLPEVAARLATRWESLEPVPALNAAQ